MAGRSLQLPHPASSAFKLFSGLLLWSISSLNEKILLGALHSSSEDKVSRPEIGSLGCKWRSLCVVRWFITVWLRSRFRKSSHTQSGSQISLTWSRRQSRELKSVFCLSFYTICNYRTTSAGNPPKSFLISFPDHHSNSRCSEEILFHSVVFWAEWVWFCTDLPVVMRRCTRTELFKFYPLFYCSFYDHSCYPQVS